MALYPHVKKYTVYLCVDEDGTEHMIDNRSCEEPPYREDDYWRADDLDDSDIELPQGTIKKLIGRELTWEDDYVEFYKK